MIFRRSASLLALTIAGILLLGATAWAQNSKSYAVLPFKYSGPKKFGHFPMAFQASLQSKLEWSGHAMPVESSETRGMSYPKSDADAIRTAKSVGADYLVYGTITILDKEAALDLKVRGVNGLAWNESGQVEIDDITPWLDAKARDIQGDVFNRPGYGKAAQHAGDDIRDEEADAAPTGAQFLQAQGSNVDPNTLNPQFRYEGGAQDVGRWRSQTFRWPSYSMVVGDGDGDGRNEVFLFAEGRITALRYHEGKLKVLDEIEVRRNDKPVRLELIDIDRDGVSELVYSAYHEERRKLELAPEGWPRSGILSFSSGKFKYLLKGHKDFLGVLRIPPSFQPILVTQKVGTRHLFDQYIYEAYFKDGNIVKGQKIASPEFATIYNMAYLPDQMGFKYIVLSDSNKLRVYDQTMERQSESADSYNSSGIGIEKADKPAGFGPGMSGVITTTFNVPFRMLPFALPGAKRYELLVNKDISIAAQVFERFRYFSQGEVHSMYWDGVGMNLAWKTRRIKGMVADIAVADLNNDGNDQLCVLVNTFPGALSFTKRKTVVLAYDLNM
ncbi:FG-GAP repeat domain-containing protein [Pseudodesulfovibrio tunisiensis]|uniref:FG-GAP repeat domain-containing protein n=1 Tax=Pseudodesulfovibrio tunisiensis TaxID=463192 RepID=UPI001FB44979|nr:VCBS repeat-containing protein [Pseudodesulfovibrio tunisiensis]